MPEKFDFSKIKDQKKFDRLPPEDKNMIIGEAQAEAGKMSKLVESGEAEDYPQAAAKIEEIKSEKERFSQKLEEITNRQLTVENINYFADEMLNSLVTLTVEMRENYQGKHPGTKLKQKELEDAATQAYELSDIGELLDTAAQKVEQLKDIDKFIKKNTKLIQEVITPPAGGQIIPGDGHFEFPDVLPRLKTLMYILQADFGIDLKTVSLTEGIIRENMMRRLSYITLEIPEINRIVQVCDEEGNASYVFDMAEAEKAGLSVEDLNNMTKDQKNKIISANLNIGRRINQSVRWRDKMSALLSEIDQDGEENFLETSSKNHLPCFSVSELDPWRGFWTDPETGKHWGSVRNIGGKTGWEHITTKNKLVGFEKRTMIDASNRERSAYCYEDFLEKYKDELALPQVETEGNWRGFWTDPETGKHWGFRRSIGEKINRSDPFILKRIEGFKYIKVFDLAGSKNSAYCYEDFLEKYKDELALPQVETEGNWRGFWTDPETGKHWGGETAISKKINRSAKLINTRRDDMKCIEVGGIRNKPSRAYCYEDFLEKYKDELALPKVEIEGEWSGFWTDPETGKHWGGERAIGKKIRRSSRYIHTRIDTVTFKIIAGVRNKPDKTYCFEDFLEKTKGEKK